MGTAATDYTPQQVIDGRYQEAMKRRDTTWFEVRKITVAFDPNFDEFAASTAYELRTRLYYRHDGGRNARGLVRATGDLATIHKIFATGTPPPSKGTPIRLNAILGRRQDARANMQWVMVIRFNNSEDITFIDGDTYEVTVDPASVAEKMMKTVIHHATLDCPNLPGDPGKRICEMVKIADRLGYPKNWNVLWYYSRENVYEYLNFHNTGDKRRLEMTKATQGKVPFDGDRGYPPTPWRVYPFRQAADECLRRHNQSGDDCQRVVHDILVHTEAEMRQSFDDIHQLRAQAGGAVGLINQTLWTRPEQNLFGSGTAFLKHLVDLLKTNDTLYSVFLTYPD